MDSEEDQPRGERSRYPRNGQISAVFIRLDMMHIRYRRAVKENKTHSQRSTNLDNNREIL